jgi:hypothetical protein
LQEPTQSVSDNTRSGGATICKGDIRIEITDSISDEFLLRIMKAVSHVVYNKPKIQENVK